MQSLLPKTSASPTVFQYSDGVLRVAFYLFHALLA